MSQLALAASADTSGRHLCFLETGRAQPSRDMVQALATALDVSLGDRNAMLLAAGYAPAYGERDLEAPELEHVRNALAFVLRQQEPFPAIVVDGGWNVVMANGASRRIFGLFVGAEMPADLARNAVHMICHPNGMRRYIVNWEEFAGALVQMLHREAVVSSDEAATHLRDAVLAYPEMPSRWRLPNPKAPMPPVLTLQLVRDDFRFGFFSTLTMLATPQDMTLERMRIECFYPADEATGVLTRQISTIVDR